MEYQHIDNRIVVSQQEVYPDDCLVDFDLELIDLFQRQRVQEQGITEQIETAFYTVKEELGHIPSRTELCLNLSGAVLDLMQKIRNKVHLKIIWLICRNLAY